MPTNRPKFPIAYIHAPRFPHEPIDIIGNQAGLERLIRVLIDAVSEGEAKGTISASDCLDSEVRATCLQGKRRPEEWKRSGSPRWDVDDPLIARIMDLTEENHRLRRVVKAGPGTFASPSRRSITSAGTRPQTMRRSRSIDPPAAADESEPVRHAPVPRLSMRGRPAGRARDDKPLTRLLADRHRNASRPSSQLSSFQAFGLRDHVFVAMW